MKTTLLGLFTALLFSTQLNAQTTSAMKLVATDGIASKAVERTNGTNFEIALCGTSTKNTSYVAFLGLGVCLYSKDTAWQAALAYDTVFRSEFISEDPYWLSKMKSHFEKSITAKFIESKGIRPLFKNLSLTEFDSFIETVTTFAFDDWIHNRTCSYLFTKEGMYRIENPTGILDLSYMK